MKILKTPTNYINPNQLGNSSLLGDYDCFIPKQSYFFDRKPIGFEFSKNSEEKSKSTTLSLNVLGKEYSVPSALFDLIEEIEESKSILDLEYNWDELGADIIKPALFGQAIDFILMYTTYIYENHQKTVISSPEINPCANGTIDFSWRTKAARMLINIKEKNGEFRASFYGYYYNNKLPLEGLIDMKNVDKTIASWMKELK